MTALEPEVASRCELVWHAGVPLLRWPGGPHGSGAAATVVSDDRELAAALADGRAAVYRPLAPVDAAALARSLAGPPPFEARGRAVLARAEELVAEPGLLAAWGRRFSAADDVSLVIAVADGDVAPLVEAVAAAGLDGEDAADLVAVPLAAERLACWCDAHHGLAPVGSLPRILV